MTKDELYVIAVNNYYHDVSEYTGALQRGDIDADRYESLVTYSREFWLSASNQ